MQKQESKTSMKNIIITGITGGIGSSVAKQLLEEGHSIIGISRTAHSVRDLFMSYGERCQLINRDLYEEKHLDVLVKEIAEQYGMIGGFIHCAGFDKMKPLYLTKQNEIEELLRIHAVVPMQIISYMAKKGKTTPGASIVLISSVAAHEGAVGHSAYAAAKGALEGYVPSAAAELMERNIRINVVVLGPVKTNMSDSWMSKMDGEALQRLKESYPLGIGKPEDAANIISFLISDKSSWITGQKIIADGGHFSRKS